MGANTKILEEAERQGLNLGDGTDVDTLTRQLRSTAASSYDVGGQEENENLFKALGTKTASRNKRTRQRFFSGVKY